MHTERKLPLTWLSHPQGIPVLDDWLFNQDSLTRRLTRLSQNRFSVRLVNEGWQTLRDDEYAALGCKSQDSGWVREVFLCGNQQPWVYARSVAGRSCLEQAGFDMNLLGTRSLGELLFSNQSFARGPIEVCSLNPDILPKAVLPFCTPAQSLWARRSCFSKDSLNILVAEAFLPDFWGQVQPSFTSTDIRQPCI